MNETGTITMVFPDKEASLPIPQNQLLPHLERLGLKSVEVSKEAISKSLKRFVLDIDDILSVLPEAKRVEIDEVSIAVEVTAEGGVQWIASATSGMSSSMTIKFKVKKPEKSD